MFRKVKVETVPLTPEVAARFANLTPLPGERSMKQSRMSYLSTCLLRGKFSSPDWALGICREDGQSYRLDGQHSSHTLVNLPVGATFPDLEVTISTYEFDSMDADASDLFNLFNNPRSVRSNGDMMGIYRAKFPELQDYSREFLVTVGNGLHEYESQRKKKAKAKDAVLFDARDRGLYFGHPSRPDFLVFTHWLAKFRGKNENFLKKPVIISEMLADYVMDAAQADEFWHLVFSESHPDPEHETRELASFLREELRHAKDPKIDMALLRKRSAKAWKVFTKTGEKKAAA
jgi:hypothetical protein